MAYDVMWANPEKTIVVQHYGSLFRAADYPEIVKQSAAMLHTVTHPVDLIILLPDEGEYTLGALMSMREIEEQVPENQRHLVVVNAPLSIKLLIDAARLVAPRATANLHHVKSPNDAFALLKTLTAHDLQVKGK